MKIRRIALKVQIFFMFVKIFAVVLFRAFKAKVAGVRLWIKAKDEGVEIITAKRFLTEFPANNSCKHCNYGQGFVQVQRADKTKRIQFCQCVLKQYGESGKKYIVKSVE